MCNLKNWIKKTSLLSKTRAVITGNILLLKYHKQRKTAALNGRYSLMLLATALRKSRIY